MERVRLGGGGLLDLVWAGMAPRRVVRPSVAGSGSTAVVVAWASRSPSAFFSIPSLSTSVSKLPVRLCASFELLFLRLLSSMIRPFSIISARAWRLRSSAASSSSSCIEATQRHVCLPPPLIYSPRDGRARAIFFREFSIHPRT